MSVPFESAKIIVEFGAASGAVTKEIIRRKNSDTLFFAFEKNSVFFDLLSNTVKGENATLVNASVFESAGILSEQFAIDPGSVDCIVSTLPCSNIDIDTLLRRSVFPLLDVGGLFIQYMHVISLFKGYQLKSILASYFESVNSKLVMRNVPPVIIYNCSRF